MTLNRRQYIDTTWECKAYDVWGNEKDGFEVNDVTRKWTVELRIPLEINNAGTAEEFASAWPTDSQIRKALGLRRFAINVGGDDLSLYVDRARDGYPCGEMYCTSHKTLGSIK